MTIDKIVSRLHKVKKSCSGYTASCPAHDDTNPSLSLTEKDGRVLIYCHAGCSYREICDALGIGMLETDRDLMATKRGREIAKLSRLSHLIEVSDLVQNYGLSSATAGRLVRERLRRSWQQEVREFLKGKRNQPVDALDYFVVEIGLERGIAEALVSRFIGRQGDD
jgi:hypothetical protein